MAEATQAATAVPQHAESDEKEKTVTLTHTGNKADNFTIDYSDHQIWDKTASAAKDEIIITYQKPYNGARFRTPRHYNSGRFGADIKTCKGKTDGIVMSFYTSSLEGPRDMDEIDFEFLGKNKRVIQTNFWVDGKGDREKYHDLGFDSSEAFHRYEMDIQEDRITWLIDGKVIRVETKDNHKDFPHKPFYLYSSVWNASEVNHGKWAGKCTWENEPYYMCYKNVTVPAEVAMQCPLKEKAYKCGYGDN